jgi:hypothetical protein
LSRPHLQQHPLKKAEMGFYAITLGFDLSSITKVNAALNMSIHFLLFTRHKLPATRYLLVTPESRSAKVDRHTLLRN